MPTECKKHAKFIIDCEECRASKKNLVEDMEYAFTFILKHAKAFVMTPGSGFLKLFEPMSLNKGFFFNDDGIKMVEIGHDNYFHDERMHDILKEYE